jgi:hypothetical protein
MDDVLGSTNEQEDETQGDQRVLSVLVIHEGDTFDARIQKATLLFYTLRSKRKVRLTGEGDRLLFTRS